VFTTALEPTNVLHRRFRSIITLLTLVAAINNGGQPRISVDPKAYSTLHRDQLLDIATLLVGNYDNVTIAVNSSYKVVAFRLASVDQEADAVADDDESEYQETEPSESTIVSANAPAPNVIATTNPLHDDDYSFGNNLYLLVEKGTSHIGEHFGDWDTLLAIP